jgi:hypothetical protein
MWYWRTVVEITDGDFEEVGGSVGWAARLGDTLVIGLIQPLTISGTSIWELLYYLPD